MFEEVMTTNKPILVTGSHRSGSTWVGRMLALSSEVAYIHEPFNIDNYRPGVCEIKFKYYFPYLTQKFKNEYFHEKFEKLVNFSFNYKRGIIGIDSSKAALTTLRDCFRFYMYRRAGLRPLIKDPIALFSSEWLAANFDMEVVVLIRHPAAFASSLKMANWKFPFSHFIEQPLLMQDYLHPFESEIKAHINQEKDIIDQAALLWKIFHHTIIKFREKHRDWFLVRHEDLSLNSLVGFQSLFNNLNLNFTEKNEQIIKNYSGLNNHSSTLLKPDLYLPSRNSVIRRNSKANIHSWKYRLTKSEIKRIRNQVECLSTVFYSDDDWA